MLLKGGESSVGEPGPVAASTLGPKRQQSLAGARRGYLFWVVQHLLHKQADSLTNSLPVFGKGADLSTQNPKSAEARPQRQL
jgi:hypothetical protein